MDALKWLWQYVKKYRTGYFVVFILSAVFAVCGFINPVILGWFVDDVIRANKTELLLYYTVLLIAAAVLKEIVTYIRQVLLEKISQNTIKAVRNKLYDKLQSLDLSFFDHTKTGDLMSRLTMDTDSIRVLLAVTIPNIINQFFFIVIGFFILISVDPIITLCLFAPSPLIGVCAYLLAKTVRERFIRIRESNAELNTVVRENIEGNRVVKAYAKEDYEIEKFEKHNQDYMDSFMYHVMGWIKYGPTLHYFVVLINVIFIVVGGLFVLNGSLTVGEFTTINGCLWCITTPMASIGDIISQFQQFNASSLKIRSLEKEEPHIYNKNVKKRSTGINGKIEFKNVIFSYDGERVLKYLNFYQC